MLQRRATPVRFLWIVPKGSCSSGQGGPARPSRCEGSPTLHEDYHVRVSPRSRFKCSKVDLSSMPKVYVEGGPDPEEVEELRERFNYGSGRSGSSRESEKPMDPLPPVPREREVKEDGTWILKIS